MSLQWTIPAGLTLLFLGDVAQTALPIMGGEFSQFAHLGAVGVLGYLCYQMIQRDKERDKSFLERDALRDQALKSLTESVSLLREHCAGKRAVATWESQHDQINPLPQGAN